MATTKYTKEDQKKIKRLENAETKLTGEETSAELDTLIDALDLAEKRGADDEETVRQAITGVPDDLPVRSESGAKGKTYPIWFVAAVTGGFALYGLEGRRMSGVEDSQTKLSKMAARYNQIESTKRRLA